MSAELRKIEFYEILFLEDDEEILDSNKLLEMINLLDSSYIYIDEKSYKFWILGSKEQKNNIFKLIFKSAKYNHSPNYISKLTGEERKSDKHLYEGECEKTHLLIDISRSSLVIESRRNGITAFDFSKYVNKFINEKDLKIEKIKVVKELKNNFLENLDLLKRVQNVELFVEKELIGSDYMNLIGPLDEIQDEVIIKIKAKRKKSLSVLQLKERFKRMGLQEEKTRRIRVRGKDSDDITVLLDTLNQCKVEQINVDLNANGTVNSESFFERLMEIL